MYASESATAVAATPDITILTSLSTAFSIQRLCALGSRDQAQSAGMLAKFPSPRFNARNATNGDKAGCGGGIR
jgi:hypothetical protein